jgi:hypothetical protein
MGALRQFTCNQCGYSAEVSGGADRGFVAKTLTVVCRICQEISDVSVGQWPDPDASSRGQVPTRITPRCPRRSSHPVQPWTPVDPCPKCGGRMENKGMTVLWD